jgi:hypothetical protein
MFRFIFRDQGRTSVSIPGSHSNRDVTLCPGSELNEVVNPIALLTRERESLGPRSGREVARREFPALAPNGQRILKPADDSSQVVAWQAENETPGAETLGVWC